MAAIKRANGTGSVYQRVKGRGLPWTAQVTIGYRDSGTPIYNRKTYPTKTEALQALGELKNQKHRRAIPSLSYYFRAFERGRMTKISSDKQRAYRIAYNRLKTICDVPVNELTIVDLQKVVDDTCPSYYTARDVKVLLNHLYRLAATEGNVNHTIPSLIELPRLVENKREPFTDEEQLKLWYSYEAGRINAALPLIMIYTGMMTAEVRALRKSSINWETQELLTLGVKTEVRRNSSILLPDAIIPVLADVVSQATTDLLYPMLGDDDFYAYYYKALRDAGITRHLTPYSCRHTTATALAVNANVAPQTVQRIMRWSSTKMMDRYVHPDDHDARNAINRI